LEQGNRSVKSSTKPSNSAPADAPHGDVSATDSFGKMPSQPPTKCREDVSLQLLVKAIDIQPVCIADIFYNVLKNTDFYWFMVWYGNGVFLVVNNFGQSNMASCLPYDDITMSF